MTEIEVQRFMAKVEMIPFDTCWHWTAAFKTKGYGAFGLHRRVRRAHCVAYEHFVGEIPAGAELDHLCRNRACVNPAHLEVVSRRENTLRGLGPTAMNARKTHCMDGHPLDGDNLVIGSDGHRRCRTCRRQKRAA